MSNTEQDNNNNLGYSMGFAAGRYIAESAALQAANAGKWKVCGEISGRTIGRLCHNWAGARLALSLLEKRGARFLRYERVEE